MIARWRLLALSLLGLGLIAAAPTVYSRIATGLLTSSGTQLTMGAISDGQALVRSGTTIAGSSLGGGGTPTPTAAGDMIGTTDGAAWVKRTLAQVKSDLGLGTAAYTASTDYQPAAANLDAVSASATSGDVLAAPGGTVAWSSLAEAGIQPADADLTTYAGITPSAAVQSILDDASISAIQTTLGGGLGRTPIVHTAAAAPTVNEDSGDGYQVGDLWQDTSGNATYQLDDATVGAADWRALLNPETAPRSVLITVRGGTLGWIEQYLRAGTWADLPSSTFTALSVDTDGGVTFAGTTATLPTAWTTQTACASQQDERYVLVSSWSATMQALIATGRRLSLQASETSMETTADSRWGCALAVTGGTALDATSECIVGTRMGYTGTVWSVATSYANFSYTAPYTGATMGQRELTLFGAGGTTIFRALVAGAYSSTTGSPKTSLPDRVYWTAGAGGTVSGTTDVVAPVCRLVAEGY